jgi:SAM-dependent methyltransferase
MEKESTEIGYWDWFFTEKGGQFAFDYVARQDPERRLSAWVEAHLPASPAKIIDVGAGPVTVLGKVRSDGLPLEITATDLLAKYYDEIMLKHNFIPLVRTIECSALELTKKFGANSFDLAYAMNSLDHCEDPLLAIKQMLSVTRGYVLLEHNVAEGTERSWNGMHGWDFLEDDGDFVIENARRERINISKELKVPVLCDVQGRWLRVSIRKES